MCFGVLQKLEPAETEIDRPKNNTRNTRNVTLDCGKSCEVYELLRKIRLSFDVWNYILSLYQSQSRHHPAKVE